jgi:hypothetical protein
MARHHVKSNDLFLALLLLVTGAATIIDLTSDGFNKESLTHLLIEGFIFLASSAAFVVLFVRIRKDLAIISSTRSELTRSHADAAAWKKRANVFIMGLGEEIQAQFDQWDLTPAEKEVTHRSERTIRQHAGSVYQKSDLTGRAELSAFFLEDLLTVVPTGNAYDTPDRS